ncbi:iron chelate uptake ABC transporter family permease subunit [Aneurinibacillus sp. Ricciae_BoGa-3]|uniref:FecCD family ABC transporter permease n=1 Tax=Aneurinibacillus sp. Ricciae_BoGa-3 TaxID=3022697 RepID=UPI00233FD03F|nr:iron chelate uptake ABC transporter family permease subunit [Aneurinibacillus sp. Ricciae_BoGa-3]WCK53953.1 iron chelate uptake ABC transporter family permease subunit [Aneurinibacillus sp. Ricciae_BoGa-3]
MSYPHKNRRHANWAVRLAFWAVIMLAVLIVAVVASVSFGSVRLPVDAVWRIIFIHSNVFSNGVQQPATAADTIVWSIRMPRILLAMLIGSALASSGAVFQGVLRNPLADPYILGVSSGASLGAALVIMFSSQLGLTWNGVLPLVAFLGGVCTLFVVYRLASAGSKVRMETLLLSGVIIQAFLGAGLSLVLAMSHDKMQQIIYWLMGSLTLSDWSSGAVIAPYSLAGFVIMYGFSRELNILSLGERNAHHLGMNVAAVRFILLAVASLTASAAVAVSGVIGFVGLIVPHIMRSLVGPDYRVLLPVSALGGAILLIVSDTLARTVMQPQELPIGVITAFLGAPFFAYLLRTRKLQQ